MRQRHPVSENGQLTVKRYGSLIPNMVTAYNVKRPRVNRRDNTYTEEHFKTPETPEITIYPVHNIRFYKVQRPPDAKTVRRNAIVSSASLDRLFRPVAVVADFSAG